jgi:type I restriction enzyme S subunit
MGNNNNTKSLYKMTIPSDWRIKPLGDICKIERGRFSPRPRNDPKYYNGKIPFVQTSDVTLSSGIVDSHTQSLNEEGLKVSKLFKKGTILITIASNIGYSAILDYDMACPDSLIGLSVKDGLDSTYLNYYLRMRQKRIEYDAPGAQKNINVEFLKPYPILTPPLPEQRAIANVLSLIDSLIFKNKQLIAHKELRKKWLMQNLLTGKKRIKGYENVKWKTQPISNFIKSISREIDKPNDAYLGIGIRSHGKGTFLKPNEEPEKNSMDKFYIVRENDLIVNITFAWEQAIAIVKPEDDGALASHRFPTYTFIKEKGHPDFFRFFILQPRMKYMLQLISPGGAGRNRVMSKSDFIKLEFSLPDYKEQSSIAQVLQASDKEIQLLKTKTDMLRKQKKGLMQVLLTGKKRVTHLID